jgi:hypothetical protein
MTHGLAIDGHSLPFGAIDNQMPQAQHAGHLAQPQDEDE